MIKRCVFLSLATVIMCGFFTSAGAQLGPPDDEVPVFDDRTLRQFCTIEVQVKHQFCREDANVCQFIKCVGIFMCYGIPATEAWNRCALHMETQRNSILEQ